MKTDSLSTDLISETYQVDRDMIGDLCLDPGVEPSSRSVVWDFCEVLQGVLDAEGLAIEIVPVLGLSNGARNEEVYEVPEKFWLKALDLYIMTLT